jgi:uncharacterized protein with ParB-like and HNH nuclease domain
MSQFITLNTVIGNGKSYKVPIYQRDYSWDKDDWDDLWNDILEIPNDKTHYLGYLVLQPIENEGEESYWVIDGQQRLTTLSIIALSAVALLKKWQEDKIDPEDNEIRFDKLTERYLGNFSTSRLTISPKITLNRNNDDYFKSWLLKHRQPTSLSKLKPTQKLLQKAFNYYFDKMKDRFKGTLSGAELADFLEKTIGNGIVFTQIVVNNDLDAFKVFETLNARGVKLSTADLLKNFLFKLTHQLGELDLDEAERQWQSISDTIRANDITSFIRHYWNSAHSLERQPTLFKAIKREINNPKLAFTFLSDLERNSLFYTAFSSPSDELWSNDERKQLQVISLLEVTTCYPLMLSYLSKLDRSDFHTLLREIAVISLRYNMSDRNPNAAETVYSDVANQIRSGALNNVRDITIALSSIYVDDSQFENVFASVQISTKRKKEFVKYLLMKLENQLASTDYTHEDATATIEHILPENPGSAWEQSFKPEIQGDFIYRFGNYTLLKAGVNNKLDNETSFLTKLEFYKQSAYKLSSDYCLFDDFNPNTLRTRQERLAKIAKTVWKSAFIK